MGNCASFIFETFPIFQPLQAVGCQLCRPAQRVSLAAPNEILQQTMMISGATDLYYGSCNSQLVLQILERKEIHSSVEHLGFVCCSSFGTISKQKEEKNAETKRMSRQLY